MALDAALRERLLRLTPEDKAEVLRLVDGAELAPEHPKISTIEWLDQSRGVRDEIAREMSRTGATFDAVAEIRALRDGL